MMDFELAFGYHDSMMLFHDDDEKAVKDFCARIEDKVVLRDNQRPRIVLYPRIALARGSKFNALEFGMERCTFVILYVTAKFVNDTWSQYCGEACLIEAIRNKQWRVVPVYISDTDSTPYRKPFAFNPLKEIYYSSDENDFDAIKDLFNDRICVRKNNEKLHLQKQIEWLSKNETREIQHSSTVENDQPTEPSVAQQNDQLTQQENVSENQPSSREDGGRGIGTSVDREDIVTDNPPPLSTSDLVTDTGSSSDDGLKEKNSRNSNVRPTPDGASNGSSTADTTKQPVSPDKLEKAVANMSIMDQEKARIQGIESGNRN